MQLKLVIQLLSYYNTKFGILTDMTWTHPI